MNKTKTVRTIKSLRAQMNDWRLSEQKTALVPTMGSLHDGHLSLVKLAKKKADRVVVSIFVNPTQFAPNEDFDTYPREEKRDRDKLQNLETDLIFAPSRKQMYAEDFSTRVTVDEISTGLCGASRPHFFGGVATVVCKLLLQALPTLAIFGEKDYQQLLVIKRMVRDLDIPVSIIGGPIIRETDGLAMSSRNKYLTSKERLTAPLLHATLTQIANSVKAGKPLAAQIRSAKSRLKKQGFDVDYLEARNTDNLRPEKQYIPGKTRLFAAAYLGRTRLIDNLLVK